MQGSDFPVAYVEKEISLEDSEVDYDAENMESRSDDEVTQGNNTQSNSKFEQEKYLQKTTKFYSRKC